MKYGLLLLLLAVYASSHAQTESQARQPAPWVAASSHGELPQEALLAIGVLPLASGVPDDNPDDPVYALRDAESRYFAYYLRELLDDRASWGPVRVLPQASHAVELTITGSIHHSGPGQLGLDIRAEDASGRLWINRRYQSTAAEYGEAGAEPFQALYQAIADDLETYRQTLTLADLRYIVELAELRYAEALAPSAFNGYLSLAENGQLTATRLPSRQDPVMLRVLRIRQAEYLFTDTVDLQYQQYYRDLKPIYLAWRRATLDASGVMAAYREQASRRKKKTARQKYNELRELKLYQQTLRDNLAAFSFEVSPSTVEVAGQTVQLSGTLNEQQRQWQSLLERIYAEEVGELPAGG